jgi:hypothetical protein
MNEKVAQKKKPDCFQTGLTPNLMRLHHLFFAYFNDLLAFVRATLGANMVRDMVLAAVFAYHQMLERQRVVRTAAITPTARRFAFR